MKYEAPDTVAVGEPFDVFIVMQNMEVTEFYEPTTWPTSWSVLGPIFSTTFSSVNGVVSKMTYYEYQITAAKPGEFTLPEALASMGEELQAAPEYKIIVIESDKPYHKPTHPTPPTTKNKPTRKTYDF